MKNPSSEGQAPSSTKRAHLFYGEEFLVKQQVAELIRSALPEDVRDTNLTTLDGANLDISLLSTHVYTSSLFGGPRMLLVEQTAAFQAGSDNTKALTKALQAWNSGDTKVAFRAFGQYLALAQIPIAERAAGEVVSEIRSRGTAATSQNDEALSRLAEAFIESGTLPTSAGAEKALEEMLDRDLPDDLTLVFTADSADSRKKLFKIVAKRGVVTECSVQKEKYGSGLDRTFFDRKVLDTLSGAGKGIGKSALDKMYARCGSGMRTLNSELEKLITYLGDRDKVTDRDVEDLFSDFHQPSFFDLINGLHGGNLSKCLPALHESLKTAQHPLQIVGALAAEFRKIISARELLFTVLKAHWKPGMTYTGFVSVMNELRAQQPGLLDKKKHKILGMKDYPLFRLLQSAQKYPLDRLTGIMEAVLQVDIRMKSSALASRAPEMILEDLLIKIFKK
jgi:DNA polymerase III subunit delta